MFFTSDELLLTSSIVAKERPFGVIFEKIKKEEAAERAKKAKQGLIDKGVFEEEVIPEYGCAFLMLWENYCNATKYIIIDRCIIGVFEERMCVALTKVEGGYEISSGDGAFIALECLKRFEGIRRADKPKISVQETKMDYKTFREKAIGFGEKLFIAGVVSNNKTKANERLFYWDDKSIWSYNPATEIEREINPSEARAFIAGGLGLTLEVLNNG
jgi:hypothetical protein